MFLKMENAFGVMRNSGEVILYFCLCLYYILLHYEKLVFLQYNYWNIWISYRNVNIFFLPNSNSCSYAIHTHLNRASLFLIFFFWKGRHREHRHINARLASNKWKKFMFRLKKVHVALWIAYILNIIDMSFCSIINLFI